MGPVDDARCQNLCSRKDPWVVEKVGGRGQEKDKRQQTRRGGCLELCEGIGEGRGTVYWARMKGQTVGCSIKDKMTGGVPPAKREENPAAAAGRDGIACASISSTLDRPNGIRHPDPSTTVRLALERWASDIAASSTQHSPAAGDLKGQPSAACHRRASSVAWAAFCCVSYRTSRSVAMPSS